MHLKLLSIFRCFGLIYAQALSRTGSVPDMSQRKIYRYLESVVRMGVAIVIVTIYLQQYYLFI